MSAVTVTREVFTLEELSEDAKDTAMEKVSAELYEFLDSWQISEALYGYIHAKLNGTDQDGDISEKMFKDKTGLTISWSLSHCQGDGVKLHGTLYKENAPALEWGNVVSVSLINWTHIDEAYIRTVDEGGNEGESFVWEYPNTDVASLEEQLRSLCYEAEKWGYAEIEGYTCKEAVIDHLDSNDSRRFNEDGTFAPPQFWCES